MKNSLLLFLLVTCFQVGTAQDNFISKYFAKYEADPNYNSVNVTQKTFSIFTDIKTNNADEQTVLGAIAKLDGIKVLHRDKMEDAKDLYQEAHDQLYEDGDFEELVSVQTSDESFLLMIREEDGVVKELTIDAGDKDAFFLATIYGEVDLKALSRFTEVIKDNKAEWFDIFKNLQSDELVFGKNKSAKKGQNDADINVNVFPNPVVDYVQLTPKGLSGSTYQLEFFSLIGEPIKNMGTVTLPYRLEVNDLPPGAYFLRLTAENGQFKNYRIVKP